MNKKNYLFFGGNSGLGFDLIKKLIHQGNKISVFARNFSSIQKEFPNNPLIDFNKINLDNPDELEITLKNLSIDEKYDGLIYTAGVEDTIPLRLSSLKKIRLINNINYISFHIALNFFSKKNVSNNNSSVIVISSIMSELGSSGKTIYCSSKSSLNGLVRSSALELSNRNIRVNSVSPGIVLTKMGEKLLSKMSLYDKEKLISDYPLGLGQSSDITNLITFLLSEKARWITGQNIIIDGGFSIK